MPKTVTKFTKGFTLVELAVVMVISGLVMGSVVTMVKPVVQKVQMDTSKNTMDKIAKALAGYAVRNNRLPCPAAPNPTNEPLGSERGSGTDGTGFGTCINADVEGIVPFRTVGLRQKDVQDSWGRYITYRVSPAFAVNPVTAPAGYNDIHEKCRSAQWMGNTAGADEMMGKMMKAIILMLQMLPMFPEQIRHLPGHWQTVLLLH